MSDDFDWKELDDESIVVKPVAGVAVYKNAGGNITIRVQGTGYGGDDEILSVSVSAVPAIIKGLRAAIREE